MWRVKTRGGGDSDGEVGPFVDAIIYEKDFYDDRGSPVSMVRKGPLKLKIKLLS